MFVKCMQTGVCLGGTRCSEGAQGTLCQNCKRGWTKPLALRPCVPCPGISMNIIRILGTLLIIAFVVWCLIKSTIEAARRIKGVHSVAFKIVSNYIVLTSVAFAAVNLKDMLPNWVQSFAGHSEAANQPVQAFMSLDCLVGRFLPKWPANEVYLVVSLALPPVLLFVTTAVSACWNKCGELPSLTSKLMPVYLVILFMVHPSITANYLENLRCVQLAESQPMLLFIDQDKPCSHGGVLVARPWLALGGLIVYSFGIPLCLFLVLFYNRNVIYSTPNRLRLGMLTQGYGPDYYWWEPYNMVRKVLVLGGSAIPGMTRDRVVCYLLVLGIISLWLHISYRPYDKRQYSSLDSMEVRALWAFIFTVLSRMALISAENNDAPTQQKEIEQTVAVVVIAICHVLFWEKAIRTIIWSVLLNLQSSSDEESGQIYLLDLAGNLDVSNLSLMQRQYLAESLGEICTANLKTPNCHVFNHHCALAEPLIKVFAEKAMKSKGSAALDEDFGEGIWQRLFGVIRVIGRFIWKCLSAKDCPCIVFWRWLRRRGKSKAIVSPKGSPRPSQTTATNNNKTFSETYESEIYNQDRYAEMWHAFKLGDVGVSVQDLQALILSHQMVQRKDGTRGRCCNRKSSKGEGVRGKSSILKNTRHPLVSAIDRLTRAERRAGLGI